MSGDAVPVVALGAAEHTTVLLGAMRDLRTAELPFVLVGGLGVMARLGTAHRATSDLDAVNGIEGFEVICSQRVDGSVIADGHLVLSGVRVDSIYVDPNARYQEIAEVDELLGRLFNMAHRFALEDATEVVIAAGSCRVQVRVATARALFVAKLHAFLSPRRTEAKRGSDAMDVVRLGAVLAAAEGSDRLTSSTVPAPVAAVARWALGEAVADPTKLARRLRSVGAPPAPAGLFELILDDLEA